MNYKILFKKLRDKNIFDAEYRYSSDTSFSLEVLKGELKNYTTNTNSLINIDALIDNKLAMINTENLSNSNIDNVISNLIENAEILNKKSIGIFKEKCKYKKFNNFNKNLSLVPIEKKIELVFNLEKMIKSFDSRISEVEVSYTEIQTKYEYQNTSGISYKAHKNEYSVGAYIVIKENNEVKTHFTSFVDNDFNKFNAEEFINELCKEGLKKLHPKKLETKKYSVIFDPEVTSTLLTFYVSQSNAELIMKNTSWFKDKINTQVANKKVTIFETPLKRDKFFTGIDAQGIPTSNRILIKKGTLLTYLHNLETAKHFNVAPTGHASLTDSKISIAPHDALYLKQGRLSKEELLNKAKDGIYITSIEGLHAGMNAQNGNFSLKAEGFIIKDGKLSSALEMMTVSSNLFNIFNKVKAISKNIEYQKNGVFSPMILVNNISISF